jgi:predicted RNase H-like HicB family nuclease
MSTGRPSEVRSEEGYLIIVHASSAADRGTLYWTEAPECPAAHECGYTPEEAVTRTRATIERWLRALPLPVEDAAGVEYRIDWAVDASAGPPGASSNGNGTAHG